LHDTAGNLINFSRSWPAPDIDVRDRDFIKVLLGADPPKTVISQPQKSKTTGQWTIFFSRRFEPKSGSWMIACVGRIGRTVGDGHISAIASASPNG
jgi:hypothetical protein